MNNEQEQEYMNMQEAACQGNTEPKVEPILCKRCGAALTEGQKFCPMCGQATSEEYTPNIVTEESASKDRKSFPKIVLCFLAAFAIVAVSLIAWNNEKTLDFQETYGEYAGQICTIASNGTWMRWDTNPDNKDTDDWDSYDYAVSSIACDEIEQVNSELGFPSSVYEKMLETTAMQGRQTESTDQYTVSWTYHPDHGLEVIYEVKGK